MRDSRIILEDMLNAIATARQCCCDQTFESFSKDTVSRFAAERALEIISEASRHLQDNLTARHTDIAWHKIRAIGNILRHEYHRVAPKIIWDVVLYELDALEAALSAELRR